ncbi:hypothetical protein N9948_01495 [bacterium]|nr:hypothetical protein [bacterium]
METKELFKKVKANLEKKSSAYQDYMKNFMKEKGKTMADMSKDDWKELGAGWKSKKEKAASISLEEKVADILKKKSKIAEQNKEALFGKWDKVKLNDTLSGRNNKDTANKINRLLQKNKVDIKGDDPRKDGAIFFYDGGSGGKEKNVIQINDKGTVFVNSKYKDINPKALTRILEHNTVERDLAENKVVDKDLINIKQFQKIKTNDVLSLQKNKLKTVMQRVDVIARKRGLRSEDETFTDSQGYASWEDKGKSVLTVTKDGIKVNKNYKKWNYLKNDLEKARKRDLGIKEEEEDV